MSDPIQRTSSVPVPRPQGIETGRNPNVLGSVADQTRLEGTTQSKADDFSSYLEKSATITEERVRDESTFDIADEVLRQSPYKTGL